MKVFLDTSLLSDSGLAGFGRDIVKEVADGSSSFFVSAMTHFQVLWGYRLAGMSGDSYERFLDETRTEVVPLTKADADVAAAFRPARSDLVDALIAASAMRHGASVWTLDKDFLKYLPKSSVRLLKG